MKNHITLIAVLVSLVVVIITFYVRINPPTPPTPPSPTDQTENAGLPDNTVDSVNSAIPINDGGATIKGESNGVNTY